MVQTHSPRPLFGDYVLDTEACYGRETVARECLVGILPDPPTLLSCA